MDPSAAPAGPATRPSTPGATAPGRNPGLDGLRGIGLLLVVGFHFGVPGMAGGFFGVDVFYVLSGYLITGILLDRVSRPTGIGLAGFWLRRARRLLPALLVVLVVVTLVVRFAEPAGTYPDFRASALATLCYVSNWWQIATSGSYFAATGPVSPLLHTWSLAIEEQFYLVWPFVVLAVVRRSVPFRTGVRRLLAVASVGAVASAVEMALLYRPGTDSTRVYFGTDTHAQSVLVGAALACLLSLVRHRAGDGPGGPPVRHRRLLTVAGPVGLVVLAAAVRLLTGSSTATYRGGFAVVDLATAAVVAAVVTAPTGWCTSALGVRPLGWVGRVSYGAYLWHLPVGLELDAGRTGLRGAALLVARVGVTFALAAVSYVLIERPVLEGRFWRTPRAAVPTVAALGVTMATILAVAPSAATAAPVAPAVRLPARGSHAVPVLLVGDSTALTLGLALTDASEPTYDGLDVLNDAIVGCGVVEGGYFLKDGSVIDAPAACNTSAPVADQWPALQRRELVRDHPRVVVLLAGRWETYDWLTAPGRTTDILQPPFAHRVEVGLLRAVRLDASAGVRTVLLTAPYYAPEEESDGAPAPEDDPARVDAYNRLVREAVAADPGWATLVDLNAIVCPHHRFTATIGHLTVRAPDGVHFTFDNVYTPDVPDPDTNRQVLALGTWLGSRLDPVILRAALSPTPTGG